MDDDQILFMYFNPSNQGEKEMAFNLLRMRHNRNKTKRLIYRHAKEISVEAWKKVSVEPSKPLRKNITSTRTTSALNKIHFNKSRITSRFHKKFRRLETLVQRQKLKQHGFTHQS